MIEVEGFRGLERMIIFGEYCRLMAPIPPTLHTDADNPWENAPLTVSIECI